MTPKLIPMIKKSVCLESDNINPVKFISNEKTRQYHLLKYSEIHFISIRYLLKRYLLKVRQKKGRFFDKIFEQNEKVKMNLIII